MTSQHRLAAIAAAFSLFVLGAGCGGNEAQTDSDPGTAGAGGAKSDGGAKTPDKGKTDASADRPVPPPTTGTGGTTAPPTTGTGGTAPEPTTGTGGTTAPPATGTGGTT